MSSNVLGYIRHEKCRRLFNFTYSFFYIVILLLGLSDSRFFVLAFPLFMTQALINILFLSNTPIINASDREIRTIANNAPQWFKKRVYLLDKE